MFGVSSSALGAPSTAPAFGAASLTPIFSSTPSSTPAFGATPSSPPVFGATPSSTPAFGASPFSTPAFGATPSSTPAFGTPSTANAFATPSSTPAFGTGFGSSSPLFSTPFTQAQQQTSSFQTPSLLGTTQHQITPFPNVQLTTQMAPVAPLPFSLAERDIQATVDAYKDDPGNPKYAYKHLLFSVTDQQLRIKPVGVSDIMWAEAMGKLEGMDNSSRERLWPQLVQGFKDLSQRLKLQDEVILSDSERLRMTQTNVKMLKRHFEAETLPRIERLRQKEQGLQRRLLRVMRIVEGLEGKGCRLPLMRGEVELAEKLAAITRQLRGSEDELSRRVQNLLTVSRIQANPSGVSVSVFLPDSTKIHERSLTAMQEVLQQQTQAIVRLGNVLKRDIRDMEIIMAEDPEMIDDNS